MKLILLFWSCFLCLTACQDKRETNEARGQECLTEARQALRRQQFDKARAAISKLRATYPYAFNAREAAILLVDSVEIANARAAVQSPGLSVEEREEAQQKLRFFQKKLEHDQTKVSFHPSK